MKMGSFLADYLQPLLEVEAQSDGTKLQNDPQRPHELRYESRN